MSIKERQMGLEDVSPEYQAFVDKFKPKLTTDDCYTPENVYAAVRAWVFAHYDLPEDTPVVRPFWPGGDYLRADYPDGCVVIDNPPFSIITKIEQFYLNNGIEFFLFAPGLSIFKNDKRLRYILTETRIRYKNGAIVNTSFATSLGEWIIETAPDLHDKICAAQRKTDMPAKRGGGKYEYPPEVATSGGLNKLASNGIHWKCRAEDTYFVRQLDQQKGRTTFFGAAFLLSRRAAAERAAAERAAAIRWELSEREQKIIDGLGAKK